MFSSFRNKAPFCGPIPLRYSILVDNIEFEFCNVQINYCQLLKPFLILVDELFSLPKLYYRHLHFYRH